jgi:dipeptidyl aminopeptidase/acylaminoacyl peptidase
MRWSLAACVLCLSATLFVGCNPAETPPPPPTKSSGAITAPVETVPAPKAPAAETKAPAATPPATPTPPAAPASSAAPAAPMAPKSASTGPALMPATNATPSPTKNSNPAPAAAAPMPTPSYLANVPLISRQKLFGNPDKAAVRSSPDGKRISYLAPVNNVMNVFVGPIDDPAAAKPVTKDTKRGIRRYFWAYSNQHILYVQDEGGDENFHVYATNIDTLETRDLTPYKKVAAQIEGVSHKFPNELLLGLNDRDEQFHDLYRLNLTTGERTLVAKNDQNLLGFVTDDDYRVRFAMKYGPTGGRELIEADGMGGFKPFAQIPMEDDLTTSPAGFDKTGDILYMLDSRGRNTAALTSYDLKSKATKVVAANDKADVGGVLSHPTEHTIEAVSFNYTREEWQILDEKIRPEIEYLKTVDPGELQVASRTLDDKTWIVAYLSDDGPVRYYRHVRGTKQAKFLFSNRKDLEGLPLVKMHPVVIKSRDGLDLVSYLSLPKNTDSGDKGRPSQPLPMVLDVHGGPWARDDWGYNPVHQMLANRGYAVLSVNFRGSTGFGKSFINAGNREWAGKMHDDLLDAVNWSVEQKIADPKKIAIMGGSYGGYATLVGLTFTPEVFACGVDIVGPSNIITLLNTIPPYWQPAIQMFKDRVGDHTTPEGKKFLDDRSPLTHVGKIVKPLLIAQGANDPRVKQSEADQIVKAMQDKKIPVTYVLYPDEGHGFARPENRMSFNAVTEAFLAQHLGGRYEPIGNDFTGSTIQIPAGVEGVPGVPAGTSK